MAKARILIVEDNGVVARDIQNSLEKLGFDVCAAAASGEKAIQKAADDAPDLVLMDILLKGEMNGTEAAEQIHSQFDIPVIYLTAYADEEVLEKAKRTEPFGYIIKPFEDRELNTAIEIALYKHKMERKTKENEEWLFTTLKSIGDGVIATDMKSSVIFMNPVAEKLTGWSQAESMGKPLGDVFRIISEITREPCEDLVGKVIATGQIIGLANHTLLLSRDGREIPIKDSGAPIVLKNGDKIGVVLVFQDDTESRRQENLIRESEERYRALFDNNPLQTVVVDTEAKILMYNFTPEKAEGRLPQIGDVMYRDYAAQHHIDMFAELMECMRTNTPKEFLDQRYKKQFLNIRMAPFSGGAIITCVDVTERKILSEQLLQSQKMEAIGNLAGGIAHDFNNILGIIIGNTELAIDDVPEWNPAKECLEEIRVASLRAKDLVRQILSFARKSIGGRKPVQIIPIIKDTLKLMRASIPTTVKIQQDLDCEQDTILCDPTQINQVLMNLCTNAAQAMGKEGGTLEVSLEDVEVVLQNSELDLKPGRYIRLTVNDTGPGMDAETLNRIFEPYFTTKGIGEGSGMGLSIVHGIVKTHDGEITIKSELGKGTAVEVFFPLIEAQAKLKLEEAEDLPTGTECILFVDDEESLVKMGKLMLNKLGYEVTTETSSVEALKLFLSDPQKFDLVITDMSMPDMAGDILAQKIKQARADIPVILCTGYSEFIDEEKAKELNIQAYTAKPLVKKDMARIVREVLDGVDEK